MAARKAVPRVEERGRVAQRRRTRKAIVDAAAALLAAGATPTVADVADAADVSRRTVYMYFPTLEQLLLDAALALATRATVDTRLEAMQDEKDVEVRVATLTRAVQENFGETEQQGRTLLRLTVDTPRHEGAEDAPRRGYRRVEWIEHALEPLRSRIEAARFEELVSALAMVIGWEAMIVLRDIRGLSVAEATDVSVWSARALVRACLKDAAPPAKRQTPKRRSPAT